MQLEKYCPFCRKKTVLNIDDKEYSDYQNGAQLNEAFPTMDFFDREIIITGMCYDCQEEVFNKPHGEHAKEWGELLGECPCCGTSIYKNHNKSKEVDGHWTCPSCREDFTYEDGVLVVRT